MTDYVHDARTIVEQLERGEIAPVHERLADQLKNLISQDALRAAWAPQLDAIIGSTRTITEATQISAAPAVVQVTIEGERGRAVVNVPFDAEARLTGINTVPILPWEPPTYGAPDLTEREVVVGEGDEFALPGTLTLPSRTPAPCVVLVHGSGPNDRDETIIGTKPFKDIAVGLGARGIAVLRYDKRTRVHGPKLLDITVEEETVQDALRAVDLARRQDGVDPDRVFVLGHSMGATFAPAIGVRDERIAGLIALAGATRDIGEIVLAQYDHIAAVAGPEGEQQVRQLGGPEARRLAENLRDITPDMQASDLPMGLSARYWLSFKNEGPNAYASRAPQPMLVLQGERDYQVTMEDFEGWKRVVGDRPDVTLKSYPALNHLFVAGTGTSGPAEYMQAGLHVDLEVISDIADWITSAAPRAR